MGSMMQIGTLPSQVLAFMISPLRRESKLFEVKQTTGGLQVDLIRTTKIRPPPQKKNAETEGVSFGQGVLTVHLDDAARVFLPEISCTGS